MEEYEEEISEDNYKPLEIGDCSYKKGEIIALRPNPSQYKSSRFWIAEVKSTTSKQANYRKRLHIHWFFLWLVQDLMSISRDISALNFRRDHTDRQFWSCNISPTLSSPYFTSFFPAKFQKALHDVLPAK